MNIRIYRRRDGEYLAATNATHHLIINHDTLEKFGEPRPYTPEIHNFNDVYVVSLISIGKDGQIPHDQLPHLPEGTIILIKSDNQVWIKDNGQWQDLETRKVIANTKDVYEITLLRLGYDDFR